MGLPVDPSSWVLVTSEAGDHTDPEPWEKGGWGDSGGEDGEVPPMELASDEEGTVSDGLSVEPEMDGGMGRWMEPMQSRLTPEEDMSRFTPEEDMIEEETSGPPESPAVAGEAAEYTSGLPLSEQATEGQGRDARAAARAATKAPNLYVLTPCWGCGGEISSGVGVTYRGRILHAASADCERAADEKLELRRIATLAAEHDAWASSPAPVSQGSRVSGYSPFEPQWAACVRAECPCTASFNGLAGEHCGLTCRAGRPCARNFHRVPREPAGEAVGEVARLRETAEELMREGARVGERGQDGPHPEWDRLRAALVAVHVSASPERSAPGTTGAAGVEAAVCQPADEPPVRVESLEEPPWAGCVRADCPCTASYNGLVGEHCGLTCRSGRACARNFHRVPREPSRAGARRDQPADWPHQELAALALEGGAGPREEEAGGAGGGPGGPSSVWGGLRARLDVVRASAAPRGPAQAAAGQQGLAMARPLITNREAMATVGAHGSAMQQARMNEAFSAQRIASIKACLDGNCKVGTSGREPTPCKGGCGRKLHMVECGSFGSARAAATRFLCAYCRVGEMHPGVVSSASMSFPSESMQRWSMQSMINEVLTGAETTAAGFADIDQLEKRWVAESGVVGMGFPRHNLERFKNFWTWVFTDASRARSADALWRQYNALFVRLELVDFTKDKGAEQHYKGLLKKSGVSHESKASCTPMMLHALVEGDGHGGIAQQHRPHPLVGARDALLYAIAGLGGPRIGEQADCGQGHGVVCSDVVLFETPDGREVVELQIRTAKTGFARYTPIAGTTRSGVQLAKLLRAYWKAAGFELVGGRAGRYRFWRASRMVLRVSLLGKAPGDERELLSALSSSGNVSARLNLETTKTYAIERIKAGSQRAVDKKFVNVAMGAESSSTLVTLKAHIEARTSFHCEVVEAPMFMATKGSKQTLMPVSSASLFDGVKARLTTAAVKAAARGDPDLNMTESELAVANWSSHSFRRGADKQARKWAMAHGVPLERVDLSFGWNQAIHAKDMQMRYDEMDLDRRMEAAGITSVHITSEW